MPQSFNTVYQNSIQNPEAFWGEAAEQLHWYKKWNKVLDTSNPPFDRWFAGGITNTCYNALDRHVEGRLARRHGPGRDCVPSLVLGWG